MSDGHMDQQISASKGESEVEGSQLRIIKDDVAQAIRELVAELIGRSPCEVLLHESLLDQGLDSLELTELLSQLEDRYHLKLDPLLIWDNDSIDLLADAISRLIKRLPR